MLAAALVLTATRAQADRVVVLPSRGGSPDEGGPRSALDIEVTRALVALGHAPVPEAETIAALATVADGVADTNEEYRSVGLAAKADWVIVGTIEAAVVTQRVELAASLVSLGRVESVARDVQKAQSAIQVQEMVAVLLRPEGIGVGALPWEAVAPAPTKPKPVAAMPEVAPPPPKADAPSEPRREGEKVSMDYFDSRQDVWPPYSAGNRGFVTAAQGFAVAAARPGAANGSPWSIVAHARGGYALGDAGIEAFAQIGGNLVGPRALWVDLGVRWMFTPSLHRLGGGSGPFHALSFHMGPELTLGAFMRLAEPDVQGPDGTLYEGTTTAHPALGVALGMALQMTPHIQLEGQIGNLRWVPTGDGSILLFGATLGAGLRF